MGKLRFLTMAIPDNAFVCFFVNILFIEQKQINKVHVKNLKPTQDTIFMQYFYEEVETNNSEKNIQEKMRSKNYSVPACPMK